VECGLVFFKGEDNKIWKFHGFDVYSVYSGCHLLNSLSPSKDPSFPILFWNGFALPKVDVFMWLLLNGSLNTKVF
jgi:hypothetical protein